MLGSLTSVKTEEYEQWLGALKDERKEIKRAKTATSADRTVARGPLDAFVVKVVGAGDACNSIADWVYTTGQPLNTTSTQHFKDDDRHYVQTPPQAEYKVPDRGEKNSQCECCLTMHTKT